MLWNNGKNMVWKHIFRCYFTNLELGLHQLPKLTLEHINLTSFAKMKVNLAVQVLSKPIAEEQPRNQMLAPYKSCNDERFTWLTQTFIKYFTDWKQSVCDRPNFSKDEKARMFISNQTFESLQITVNSLVERTKFLLSASVPYVLTKQFSQDYLEEYLAIKSNAEKGPIILMLCSSVATTGHFKYKEMLALSPEGTLGHVDKRARHTVL